MSTRPLTTADYPLAEQRPDLVAGPRGKRLDEITLAAILESQVTREDLAISATTLRHQADIARAAGRPNLAANFERAAELVAVPQEEIMRVYELLRPGRAASKDELLATARALRIAWRANLIADYVEEAAEVYERRGLFRLSREPTP